MMWHDHEAFGDAWDTGGQVIDGMVNLPLRVLIGDAVRPHGASAGNPQRVAGSMMAAAIMGAVGNIILPGFGVFLGAGGYAMGQAASYSGDRRPGDELSDEDYDLMMACMRIATKVLETKVGPHTMGLISDSVQRMIERRSRTARTWEDALEAVYDGIAEVSPNAAEQWAIVLTAAGKEAKGIS